MNTLCIMMAAVWMAGDSTMCNYADRQYPQQGWGQALGVLMKNPDDLHNRAIGGRSAKSFKAEGRWDKLVSELKAGDFVIIAFGHNDANKKKTERYSSPADYKELMRGFANDVLAKKATPVFATSIPHSGGVSTNKEGVVSVRGGAAGIGPYVATTVALAEEMKLDCINLNQIACETWPKWKLEDIHKLYMRIKPGEYDRLPKGQSDGCHTRDTGAYFFASAFVREAIDRKLPIAKEFKDPKDVIYTPIPKSGPAPRKKPMRDDFSKEEIPYAGAGK